jgi:nucleoside-diphosphate-sugar epimerase
MKKFWKNKKVLITGGAGFIGSFAVEELVRRGAIVTVTISPRNKNTKPKNLSTVLQKVKIKKVDLTSADQCLKVTKNQEVILNFAALDGSASFKTQNSAKIFKTNNQIVLNILESARLNKVDRVLLMSSTEIYSPNIPTPVKEKDGMREGLDLSNGYAWSKRFSEIAATTYFHQYGLKIAIARPGNVYGPRDILNAERVRVIPLFINKARKGETITVHGSLQKKSFLYVEDLIEALLNLVELYPVCDPVNIASSEYITLKHLAILIVELTKSKSKIVVSDAKINKKSIISIKKAQRLLHLKEKTTLKEGIKKLI